MSLFLFYSLFFYHSQYFIVNFNNKLYPIFKFLKIKNGHYFVYKLVHFSHLAKLYTIKDEIVSIFEITNISILNKKLIDKFKKEQEI